MRPIRTWLGSTAATALTMLALAGCAGLTIDAGAAPGTTPTGASAATAESQLHALTVNSGLSMSGYSRDRFHIWASQGHGCDTRDVVLKRQGHDVKATSDCKIYNGSWTSPYNGKTYTDPQAIQIDHVVPLADAWLSGAKNWSDDKREAFANDLTRPQLLAVTSSLNEAKGDQGPDQWKPPSREFWCQYAEDWISVKHFWQLTVTTAEKAALTDMLGTCA